MAVIRVESTVELQLVRVIEEQAFRLTDTHFKYSNNLKQAFCSS